MEGSEEVTSTISKLALFLKILGECYHIQTLTDVILLSWIDPRPLPMVQLCSNLARVDFLIFPSGQEKQREVSFILALFVLFCFYPIRATPWLMFRASNSCGHGESLLVPCQELNGNRTFFQGALLKVLTDVDFSFVIKVLLKRHLMSLG